MEQKFSRQLIYIGTCLLIAAVVTNINPQPKIKSDRTGLATVFSHIGAWTAVNNFEIQDNILNTLELDDYLFRAFQNDNSVISLYIGYYHTADKVGAAHSPLVCFPGQGWQLSPPQSVDLETPVGEINAEKLLIYKGQQQQLILYWFQTYDKTSSGTFYQKINSFWGKIRSKPENNAFIRVSIEVYEGQTHDAFKAAKTFIQDFYPIFFDYVTTGDTNIRGGNS